MQRDQRQSEEAGVDGINVQAQMQQLGRTTNGKEFHSSAE